MRGYGAAALSLMVAFALSGEAAAERFTYRLEAPTMSFGQPGDTYLGTGTIFADRDAGGGYAIVDANGSFVIKDYDGFVQKVSGGNGRIVADGAGGFYAETFALYLEGGGGAFSWSRDPLTGTYEVSLGEVGAPAATLALETSVAAVPEPASWAMMILGFGVVGYGLSRRAKVATTVRLV